MQRQSRTTKQRKIILEELRAVKTHPTADEIYSMTKVRLPRISLGTVYRNLDHLARHGEILCIESGAQRRFDGTVVPHAHVRCRICGRVGDVVATAVPPELSDARADGFVLTGARLEFDGLCTHCTASFL